MNKESQGNATANKRQVVPEMGGQLETLIRFATVKAERLEMDIQTKADTTVQASVTGYTTHQPGVSSSVSGTADASTSLQLSGRSHYKYWITWEDGGDELMTLPFEATVGHRLLFCSAKRTVAEGDKVYSVKKTNGQSEPWFPISQDSGKHAVVAIVNLNTNEKCLSVDQWLKERMSPQIRDIDEGDGPKLAVNLLKIAVGAGIGALLRVVTGSMAVGIIGGVAAFLFIHIAASRYSKLTLDARSKLAAIKKDVHDRVTEHIAACA